MKNSGIIGIIGIFEAMNELYNKKRPPLKWGIKAVEKDQLRKPGVALAEKKRHRKAVQASRRGNR